MTNSITRNACVLFLAVAACGCSKSSDGIEPDPPSTSAGGAATSDASPADAITADDTSTDAADATPDREATTGTCPKELPGPSLAAIPAPDGSWYCIDTREVNQREYFEFLKAKGAVPLDHTSGDTTGQRKECEQNSSFLAPWTEDEPCSYARYAFDLAEQHPDNPVACVDWCDANAYCSWAGKRLCGKIGGGALSAAERAEASSSEWFNACSQGGKTAYPYGDNYEPGTCADSTWYQAQMAKGVATDMMTANPPDTCHGAKPPFDQVFQLSGNVNEWEDDCDTTSDHPGCFVRGGPLGSTTDTQCRCDTYYSTSQYHHSSETGFRCCY